MLPGCCHAPCRAHPSRSCTVEHVCPPKVGWSREAVLAGPKSTPDGFSQVRHRGANVGHQQRHKGRQRAGALRGGRRVGGAAKLGRLVATRSPPGAATSPPARLPPRQAVATRTGQLQLPEQPLPAYQLLCSAPPHTAGKLTSEGKSVPDSSSRSAPRTAASPSVMRSAAASMISVACRLSSSVGGQMQGQMRAVSWGREA